MHLNAHRWHDAVRQTNLGFLPLEDILITFDEYRQERGRAICEQTARFLLWSTVAEASFGMPALWIHRNISAT